MRAAVAYGEHASWADVCGAVAVWQRLVVALELTAELAR